MERTLAIVKPDAVQNGHAGKILDRILQEGFAVRALKLVTLSKPEAEASTPSTASARSSGS